MATIGWTLAVTTTFLCDIGAAATHLLAAAEPDGKGLVVLSGLLLFAAVVTGVLVLLLLPLVLRLRHQKPPRGYVAFAVLVAAAPLLVVAQNLLR